MCRPATSDPASRGPGPSTRATSLLSLALIAGAITPILTTGTAFALPLMEAVVVENDSQTATVEIFMTTPDEGLIGYSFSVAYTGSLTLNQAQCFAAAGSAGCNSSVVDHPSASPPYYGSIFGLALPGPGPDFFPPFGVGGERSLVGRLTFDVNGAGGTVEPGFWDPATSGILTADWDITDGAVFSGQNLELFSFSAANIVPEPATGLMMAAGLLFLAKRRSIRH